MKIERLRINFPDLGDQLGESIGRGEIVFGPEVEKLRVSFEKLGHDKYFTFTNNGFSSLLIAIEALGIKGKKIVIPFPQTCLSIINAIRVSGNEVIFCDCNLNNANINTQALRKLVNTHGNTLGGVISPAYFGIYEPLEMEGIEIPVIEDLCQSILTYMVFGSANNQNLRVFSFYPSKNLIGIDGGCIAGNNEKLIAVCNDLSSYSHLNKDDGKTRFNVRLNDLSALVALKSFAGLPDIAKKRTALWNDLKKILEQSEKLSFIGNVEGQNWIPYKILLQFDEINARNGFIKEMNDKFEIESSIELFSPTNDSDLKNFPNSKMWIQNSCSIPFYETLTTSEFDHLLSSLRNSAFI